MLGGGRIILSRNTSSPDKGLDPGSFPWTACRIASPVSIFLLRWTSKHLNEDPVGAQWHVDLDAHGSFCIAIPLQQIIEIVETLKASNCDWEDRVESDPQALRALDVCQTIGFA